MKVYFRVWLTVLALALATLAMVILATQPVHAAGPWYVGPGGSDSNTCLSPATRCATINGALNKGGFAAGDTIRVASGTYTGTSSEVVLLDKNATLSGGWDAGFNTQSGTSTIEGQGARRGITVNSGVTAIVERFTAQNGNITGDGGGIRNAGTLTLNNSTISNNTAGVGQGAGIYNTSSGILTLNNNIVTRNGNTNVFHGTGIANQGALTAHNTIISENLGGIAAGVGVAVKNWNSGVMTLNNTIVSDNSPGSGIANDGTLTLNNSTVSDHTGEELTYGIDNGGTAILNNSIISGNGTSAEEGGGIYNSGTMTLNNSAVSGNTGIFFGGIFNSDGGTLALNNSTVSGNSGYKGGGIYNVNVYGTLTLKNSTISDNSASGSGGGIYNFRGNVTLQNTILAGNTATEAGPDCYGAIGSSGYNLIGDTSGCAFTSGLDDLMDVDPKLGQLEGSPGYHPLRLGSPAINAGNPTGCTDNLGNPLPFDQRGMPRVARCDIGAYEAGLAASKQVNGTFSPGGLVTYTITISNEEGITNLTSVLVTDTLPIHQTYVPDSFSATNGTGGESSGVITWSGAVFTNTHTVITFSAAISDMARGLVITNTAVISSGGVAITRQASFDTFARIYLPLLARNYCPPLYADDFSNPGSGWPIDDTGNVLYEYLSGEYRILLRNAYWWAGAGPGFKASNYIVAVDVRNATSIYGTYGITFGGSDDGRQFYTFEVDPNGGYVIWRYNSSSGWTALANGSSGYINPGTATNRLKVERNGSLIRAYANGQLLASVSDGSYTGSRHVGLIVSSYSQPNVDARFDNFIVYPVTCGAAATALGEGGEIPDLGGEATEVGPPSHWEGGQNRRGE